MKGMNINLNGGSPGERFVMGVFMLGILIDLADITWVRPVEATPMTYDMAYQVCGHPDRIKKLGGWEVECFTKQEQPEPASSEVEP